MALQTYKSKRHFKITPEPGPRVRKSKGEPIFVIQEHQARRHHYDFRLEADGVLKSWAVPKEPVLDPSVKRLAVHVEDHPQEYAKFRGDIPEGQYGAGHVEIWDKGTYRNLMREKPHPLSMRQAIDEGHVEVELHGRKLKGGFVLVKTRIPGAKENWLLMKMRDKYARKGAGDAGTAEGSAPVEPAVQFKNLDKVMFPEAGFTKGDVLEFYQKISSWLLPHLKDWPVTVERLPDGVGPGATHFWQKNTPAYYPSWIPRVNIPDRAGRAVHYALVNNLQTLLYMVNQGALTFHVHFSRLSSLECPDFVLFDLDPDGASFGDVVRVARQLHASLNKQKVESFVKTSGKTGLHVLTGWSRQRGGFQEVRAWATIIAQQLAKDMPEMTTVERSKALRRGRIYVDVMQNALGKHAVPPYVLRPVPEATVSTPLRWDELTSRLDPGKFTIKTIFERLKDQTRDPLAGLL